MPAAKMRVAEGLDNVQTVRVPAFILLLSDRLIALFSALRPLGDFPT